jgi:ubiquinone/menaquinone biosynthesis C-methylase UbiE
MVYEKTIEEIKRYRRTWYDDRAGIYDDLLQGNVEFREEMIGFKKLVKISNDEVILDVATGTGNYLVEMANDGGTCYGIDASPQMLEQLRRKIVQRGLESKVKEIRVCEADRLPYRENFFDWVTCIGLFEYYPIEYAEVVLKEMKRVLKPFGKCFFDIVDPVNTENLNRDYLYKYDLKSFNDILNTVGMNILSKNSVERMIQYLCLNSN